MSVDSIKIETLRGQFGARVAGEPDAPLVLCLHGFPDDASTFDGLLDRFAHLGFRAVAPYCRGYAPSPLRNPDGSRFGPDLFDVLARDALAIADSLSPSAAVRLVGHDNGSFTIYHLLRLASKRVSRAVTLAAGHPAVVYANTVRTPAQIWRSRYVFLFQVPGISDWLTRRHDFAYIERLWDRWSAPGWRPPSDHLAAVKRTMYASWPAPLEQYRLGGFNPGAGWAPIPVPLLYLAGEKDACVAPDIARGQERYFSGPFRSEVVPGVGHFLHAEDEEGVAARVVEWVTAQDGPSRAFA